MRKDEWCIDALIKKKMVIVVKKGGGVRAKEEGGMIDCPVTMQKHSWAF